MKLSGREIIDVLECVSKVEWYRYSRANPEHGEIMAPVTVWRFDPESIHDGRAGRVMRVFRSAVDEFSGNVSWHLEFFGRNWVLSPKKFDELEKSGKFRTDGEIFRHLFDQCPSLGVLAHQDLMALANVLQKRLSDEGIGGC